MQLAKKRLIVVFSMLAFLVNVMLPFYAVSSSALALAQSQADVEQGSLASLMGDKILICTTSGYKWVSASEFFANDLEENFQGGGESSPLHSSFHCPLCHLLNDDFSLQLANAIELKWINFTQQAIFIKFYSEPQRDHKLFLLNGGFTRAPPHSLT